MRFNQLSLAGLEQSWSAALAAAMTWIPSFSGSFDSRLVQVRGRDLLAALILVVMHRHGTAATMENVRELIDGEMSKPGSVLGGLIHYETHQVRDVSKMCLAARGSCFGDAVPFLALNIQEERTGAVERLWPPKVMLAV
ncbi:MAG: hypothetical protein C0456_05985 [Hyphomonas sp.]|uniref:hypothetical protein n=1 Tax=Hyphomonas sp. TaxID=87 RepID=UPI001D5E750E|nr:hypothetical protein [Hyphomonas sp.]MBA4226167.1 hypothetical protein [Hyphomonas sp.]